MRTCHHAKPHCPRCTGQRLIQKLPQKLISAIIKNVSCLTAGALINLLQKGLQYLDIESRLNEDGTELPSTTPSHSASLFSSHVVQDVRDADVAVSKSASSSGEVIASDAVTTLTGHTSEVFICKWNPKADIIASGSGDSSARLWTVGRWVLVIVIVTLYACAHVPFLSLYFHYALSFA